ncbi:isoleucine--tRNA ligase, cytoplasmic isoform X2 [Lingula anatina]|uniref:Isoleucine--tRNA ligase, cytoplasmic n=1 Tax=Lingula anatina TaxID=7574 RepID=A0A1S3IKM0_LINAN|nr:isoleucine--tRNA ligase, cytoplasmic isoform X1 [Lingula anatina]XP_013398435.1 isoleucine--tRNA ligase, cytoplasmic isoform X2 [Lingula anatina]XP_013398436.1 isoleucine--tRNA ligase, cytoplasmic isoform X2 [Lingula anatina]|eukprot:XP_013398434.1 isoleucine--tRNA ligase, cytoplasmic isoform X1 [Lingula anatina]
MSSAVPDNMNFPKEEEVVLELWKKLDAFQTTLKQSKNRPRYMFYDGPPFATGLPHYGHILAGTIKDIVTRWAHQSGYHVDRRFGWDCHGLPVEYEIDKTLGIKGPEDVAKMGIAAYNAECRKIVMRYSKEWEENVTRLGRWIDFRNDYKTMYPWFMESIWWVFKQLFENGMVYRGVKVMPFSTSCNTPLSNFEAGQNYKDVTDPAVIISFPLDEDPSVSMIGWTTTPWTLPSNLSLCVNPELDYVKVKDNETDKVYIMMEARLDALFKTPQEYTILDKFKGITLKGKKYEPLFPYYKERKARRAFQVLCDGYVTTESGTGVVHQAPYFGEDDYRVCLAAGVISRDDDLICAVDASGRFTLPVTDFNGQYVKDADKNIIRWLKEHGRLVHQGQIKHSYPFCWRSETPLVYKAVPSWFVRVQSISEKLLKCNEDTYWVPEFVKEKRFANWLRDARDWAISRNRYWGTPIPLWISDDGEEVVCVGSIEELTKLTGVELKDLHREHVDPLTIPSRRGKGVLRRVTEVFDCWFESGSMPYAQQHYPFEKKKEFEDCFPADFIAEGIDQTRGWFYTLLVLSTSLFGKPPFKNLIANGLVLAADGQKMSKSKKNYPDPMLVVNKYGADALRLYLINSPVVRAESLRFKEEGVRDILKDVFLPWFNAYRFLMQNAERLEREEGVQFLYNENKVELSTNYMDHWILSFTQSLIKYVRDEMAAYHLYTVVPKLVKFVEQLTNWYVRMNRKRLKGDTGLQDCHKAIETLFGVLYAMVKVMAPFIPFLTEHMYQSLKKLIDPEAVQGTDTDSVHYLMLPVARESLIDTKVETAVQRMQTVIELGRIIRDRKTLPLKYPLKEVVVIHKDDHVLEDVRSLKQYILEELNVKEVTTTTDKEKYGVHLRAEPDHKTLGARLKGAFKSVTKSIKELTDAQLQQFLKMGEIVVDGHTLAHEELRIMYTFDAEKDGTPSHYEAHSDNDILVLLDISPDQSMLDEGIAREVCNRIQKLRKKAKLVPADDITVYYNATPALEDIIKNFTEFLVSTLKKPLLPYPVMENAQLIIQETTQVKNDTLKNETLEISIVKGSSAGDESVLSNGPACSYVDIVLSDHGNKQATVLLENPRGHHQLTTEELKDRVGIIYGVQGKHVSLFQASSGKEVARGTDLTTLTSLTLSASLSGKPGQIDNTLVSNGSGPACRYVNVQLVSLEPRGGVTCKVGTVLLENPPKEYPLDTAGLLHQVQVLFGLQGKKLTFYCTKDKQDPVTEMSNLASLHSKTLYVFG